MKGRYLMTDLVKKLSTLINATLRGGLPKRRRKIRTDDEPAAQIKAVQDALAEVEINERKVTAQLQETRAKIDDALERGDTQAVAEQRRLARELEAQLQTQSTEAIQLAETLAQIEDRLTEAQAEVEHNLAEAQTQAQAKPTITQADSVGGQSQERVEPTASADPTDTPPATNDNDELTARKSRLSG
jgi:chromosome segregation ATPase